jgi:Domain of unknown function (DUF4192)
VTQPRHAGDAAALLLGSLPGSFGRTPEDEVLLVGLSERAGSVAVVLAARLDEDPAGTADDLLAAAVQDGAHGAVVITYAADAADPRSRAGQAAAAVVLRAPADLRLLDALWVSGGRWGSYLCPDPACCPADGNPLTTPEEHHP